MNKLTLLTRASPLALWQTHEVKRRLVEAHPDLTIEIQPESTGGDREQIRSLQTIGGKDLFASDLRDKIQPGTAAVHSLKDLSVLDQPGLLLACYLPRGRVHDALLSPHSTLEQLPKGAIVGTGSPRRQSLILHKRPDLSCQLIRGNVGTRLKKLQDGFYDAIVLAACGLERLDLLDAVTEHFNPSEFIPAIGQGIITVECASTDTQTIKRLEKIHCPQTQACADAERALNRHLGGDCFSAIGAHAKLSNGQLTLTGFVGSVDGSHQLKHTLTDTVDRADKIGYQVGAELEALGALTLLNQQKR